MAKIVHDMENLLVLDKVEKSLLESYLSTGSSKDWIQASPRLAILCHVVSNFEPAPMTTSARRSRSQRQELQTQRDEEVV